MEARYFARSASDRTEEWPFWFVADGHRGGLNVTADLARFHINPEHRGGTLASRAAAEQLTGLANARALQEQDK